MIVPQRREGFTTMQVTPRIKFTFPRGHSIVSYTFLSAFPHAPPLAPLLGSAAVLLSAGANACLILQPRAAAPLHISSTSLSRCPRGLTRVSQRRSRCFIGFRVSGMRPLNPRLRGLIRAARRRFIGMWTLILCPRGLTRAVHRHFAI